MVLLRASVVVVVVAAAALRGTDAYSPPSGRREFLSTGASAAAAAGAAATAAAGLGLDPLPASAAPAPLVGSIDLPPLGLGAWAWGDSVFWGYDKKQDGDLREVFDAAVSSDLAFFDTAELYGLGRSETLLGEFRSALPPASAERVQIASKFAALPFRTKASDVVKACRESAKRLGGAPIDLYQVHFPNAWSNAEYWDGLASAYEEGLVKAVGVSNYGADATRAAHAALAERGIKLATNQIQLSLLYRHPIDNGLLDACRDLDVKVLSYSPLALGFLTGKYGADDPPKGPRKKIAEQLFADDGYSSLLATMREVAAGRGDDVPVSQVALNWARAKGTIPIPGARTLKQAKQNIGSLSWDLAEGEVRALDEASSRVTGFITPDKSPFPKKDINTGLVMFDS